MKMNINEELQWEASCPLTCQCYITHSYEKLEEDDDYYVKSSIVKTNGESFKDIPMRWNYLIVFMFVHVCVQWNEKVAILILQVE